MSVIKIFDVPEQDFIRTMNNSTSIRQALLSLGLSDGFDNYNKLCMRCNQLNIKAQSICKYNDSIELDCSKKLTTKARNQILKENLLEYKCAKCNLSEWQGKQLSLHLHHIDGDHYNNDLSNLKFLCPSCHSQEPVHRKRAK